MTVSSAAHSARLAFQSGKAIPNTRASLLLDITEYAGRGAGFPCMASVRINSRSFLMPSRAAKAVLKWR